MRVSKAPALLVDISEGGLRVVTTATLPDELLFFWVGLVSLPCEWVKVSIQEAVRRDDRWDLRLVFVENCAPGIIERACQPQA